MHLRHGHNGDTRFTFRCGTYRAPQPLRTRRSSRNPHCDPPSQGRIRVCCAGARHAEPYDVPQRSTRAASTGTDRADTVATAASAQIDGQITPACGLGLLYTALSPHTGLAVTRSHVSPTLHILLSWPDLCAGRLRSAGPFHIYSCSQAGARGSGVRVLENDILHHRGQRWCRGRRCGCQRQHLTASQRPIQALSVLPVRVRIG